MLLSFALRRAAVHTHTRARAHGCKRCELKTDEECEEPGEEKKRKKREVGSPVCSCEAVFSSAFLLFVSTTVRSAITLLPQDEL